MQSQLNIPANISNQNINIINANSSIRLTSCIKTDSNVYYAQKKLQLIDRIRDLLKRILIFFYPETNDSINDRKTIDLSVNNNSNQIIPSIKESSIKSKSINKIKIGEFIVFEQPEEEWAQIGKVAEMWKKLALQKYLDFQERKASHRVSDSDNIIIFKDSQLICETIESCFPGEANPIDPWDKVIVSEDTNQCIQAIAIFNKAKMKIVYIASNPNNLPHITNKGRIKGAGTALILYISLLALGGSIPISVQPFETALSFYKKLGFSNDNFHPEEPFTLELNVERIQTLIKQRVYPFNLLSNQLIPQSKL